MIINNDHDNNNTKSTDLTSILVWTRSISFFVDGVEIFLGRGEWCKETSPPADDEILEKLLIAQLLRSHMVKKQSTTGDHINKIAYY